MTSAFFSVFDNISIKRAPIQIKSIKDCYQKFIITIKLLSYFLQACKAYPYEHFLFSNIIDFGFLGLSVCSGSSPFFILRRSFGYEVNGSELLN